MSRDRVIGLGPPVPTVRIGDFSRVRLTEEQWSDLWRIVGPSVEKNMLGRRPLPLWKVIAAAYMEGLNHGAGVMAEQGSEA